MRRSKTCELTSEGGQRKRGKKSRCVESDALACRARLKEPPGEEAACWSSYRVRATQPKRERVASRPPAVSTG